MKDIYKILHDLDIAYVKHEHPAVFTCEEAMPYYVKMRGATSKNIFLRNRKADKHYLIVLPSTKKLDIKSMTKELGESKLGFASPERLLHYLGLTPGSVSPFGLINDSEKAVTVIIDEELMNQEYVNFHPNINTATLELTSADFRKFLEWCGNKTIILPFIYDRTL